MNPVAIERANERLRQAAEGRIDPVVAEAALERGAELVLADNEVQADGFDEAIRTLVPEVVRV